MENVVDIQACDFNEELNESDKPVIVEFWIKSCSHCSKFKSVYEQLPTYYGGDFKFFRMNMFTSIENLRLAEDLGVEQTPTTKIFCKGREIGEVLGYRPLNEAVQEINLVIDSDEDCKLSQ